MTFNEILSSLRSAKTSDFVYSSLGFYGDLRQRELPGLWFVSAIGALGVEETTIRQTLFRMEKSGALEARTLGRSKLYRPTPATRAVIDAGTARILDDREDSPWDQRWTMVRFVLGKEERKARDLLRDILTVEGFASLGSGFYVHPRERTARIIDAVDQLGLRGSVHVFRGERIDGPPDPDFIADLWDLPTTASRYLNFLRRYKPLERRVEDCDSLEAFGLRFALVFEFLRITWSDPDVPAQILPPDWPADDAGRLARSLYQALLPKALDFGDQIMNETLHQVGRTP